jgi:Putative prokaryotic signal transducing protein
MTRHQDPDSAELTEVFASLDPTEIRIARDMLEGAGIECFVFDRESSRMLGTTAAVPLRLMVHTDRAKEALGRLKDLGFT